MLLLFTFSSCEVFGRRTSVEPKARLLGYNPPYGVFHDLWTLLQEVISQVFVIKEVRINMCPILDGYGVMTA